MSLPAERFRDALAAVATAVCVAATVDGHGRPRALTVGSLCSLSLDPPLVLFCLARSAGSHAVFCSARRFALTVLAEGQADVARSFAGPRALRVAVPLVVLDQLPVVPHALAYLLCSTHSLVPGGDHTIVIGRVRETAVHPGRPLLYHQRDFRTLASEPASRGEAHQAEPLGVQHGAEPVAGAQLPVQPLLMLGHGSR